MIRKATIQDLEGIMTILKTLGNPNKDSVQGFLIADYARQESKYRPIYEEKLQKLQYFYVNEHEGQIQAFLIAYTQEEWLLREPNWLKETCWDPRFDQTKLKNFVLVSQTAMLPHLTRKGIGSALYQSFIWDLQKDKIKNIFAETVIAPIPNFASLNFRLKQQYTLVGLRYEKHNKVNYTTLIYHKGI